MTTALTALAGRWVGACGVLAGLAPSFPAPSDGSSGRSACIADISDHRTALADGSNLDAVDLDEEAGRSRATLRPPVFLSIRSADVFAGSPWMSTAPGTSRTHDSISMALKSADTQPTDHRLPQPACWYVGLMPGSLRPGEHSSPGPHRRGHKPPRIRSCSPSCSCSPRDERGGSQDFEASRDHLDKALAVPFAAVRAARRARLLVRIIGQLLDNHDAERALACCLPPLTRCC